MIKHSIYVKCQDSFQLLESHFSLREALENLRILEAGDSSIHYQIMPAEDSTISFADAKLLEV